MQKTAKKKQLQDFVKQFTARQVYQDLTVLKDQLYEQPQALRALTDRIDDEPVAAGVKLGAIIKGRLVPGIALLERLCQSSEKIVTVSDEGAWLFVCGRDVMAHNVVRGPGKGPAIVQNQLGEVLGWGELVSGKEIALKNRWDIGDFLRRERKQQ